jgi:hypothetical protein
MGERKRCINKYFRLSETVLGKEHPNTLRSMDDLAGVLRDQGKYEQVGPMFVVNVKPCRSKFRPGASHFKK